MYKMETERERERVREGGKERINPILSSQVTKNDMEFDMEKDRYCVANSIFVRRTFVRHTSQQKLCSRLQNKSRFPRRHRSCYYRELCFRPPSISPPAFNGEILRPWRRGLWGGREGEVTCNANESTWQSLV